MRQDKADNSIATTDNPFIAIAEAIMHARALGVSDNEIADVLTQAHREGLELVKQGKQKLTVYLAMGFMFRLTHVVAKLKARKDRGDKTAAAEPYPERLQAMRRGWK